MMRRIVTLVVVALVMAAMMAVGAGPASAIVPISKEYCKEFKPVWKAELGSNQGQCIKLAKDSPVLLPY